MRCLRHALPFALGLSALLTCPALLAEASAALPLLSALTQRADRIVVTEVIEVRSVRESGRGDDVPVTLVTVRVERALKGAGSSQVVLEFLGGRVDGDALEVLDVPRFAVGDRDVLFLAAGGRRVSPLVGVMHGRFRLVAGADARERVTAHDGRPLTGADLSEEGGVARDAAPAARDDVVSLAEVEKAILVRVARAADYRESATASRLLDVRELKAGTDLPNVRVRLDVEVALGPSPALLDGCLDWDCALASRSWFRTLTGVAPGGRTNNLPAQRVSLEWGHSVFGRLLDTDTLALAVRRTTGGQSRALVIFNERLPWNAYAAGASASAGGPMNLPAVAARELSLVAASAASTMTSADGAAESVPHPAARADSRGTPLSRAVSSSDPLAEASGCGPGGVFVDPHRLVFDSPDHALMTAYQVGFFQPGAASPAQVVDLPLAAFMTRRVIDMPAWAVAALQTSLVADIGSAGLATPIGLVYTYRVRGVWAGGTTGWSNSSQPFVRCTATAAVAR